MCYNVTTYSDTGYIMLSTNVYSKTDIMLNTPYTSCFYKCMTDRLLKKTYVHHLNHLRDYVFTQYALRSVLKKAQEEKRDV